VKSFWRDAMLFQFTPVSYALDPETDQQQSSDRSGKNSSHLHFSSTDLKLQDSPTTGRDSCGE
jgi:hypothetical protein